MAFLTHDVIRKNVTPTQFRGGYDEHEVDEFPELALVNPTAQQAEEHAEGGEAATGPGDEVAGSGLADARSAVAATEDEGQGTSEAKGVAAEGNGSAVGLLALAQTLHEQYVSEGKSTRERLITEGQSHHDQVVGEATAKKDDLLSTGQAKYDELVSLGEVRHAALVAEADALLADAATEHEVLITEARERSSGLVAEAHQQKADVLQELASERRLLQGEIDELRVFEGAHRARLKSYLQSQLTDLEQTGADVTAPGEGDANQQGGH